MSALLSVLLTALLVTIAQLLPALARDMLTPQPGEDHLS